MLQPRVDLQCDMKGAVVSQIPQASGISDVKFSRLQEEEKEAELLGLNKLLNQEPFCC